jgi:hypothetical protein
LLLSINYNNYFTRTTISNNGNKFDIVQFDSTLPDSAVHSGGVTTENTFDTVKHIDLYKVNATELLVKNVAQIIPEVIAIDERKSRLLAKDDVNTIDINPPFRKVV